MNNSASLRLTANPEMHFVLGFLEEIEELVKWVRLPAHVLRCSLKPAQPGEFLHLVLELLDESSAPGPPLSRHCLVVRFLVPPTRPGSKEPVNGIRRIRVASCRAHEEPILKEATINYDTHTNTTLAGANVAQEICKWLLTGQTEQNGEYVFSDSGFSRL